MAKKIRATTGRTTKKATSPAKTPSMVRKNCFMGRRASRIAARGGQA